MKELLNHREDWFEDAEVWTESPISSRNLTMFARHSLLAPGAARVRVAYGHLMNGHSASTFPDQQAIRFVLTRLRNDPETTHRILGKKVT